MSCSLNGFLSPLRTFTATLLGTALMFAGPKSPKLPRDFADMDECGSVDVIIQYSGTPAEKHHSKVKAKGGQLKQVLPTIKGAAYSVPAAALSEIAAKPEVSYVTPDRPLSSTLEFPPPALGGNIGSSSGRVRGAGIARTATGTESTNVLINGER